MTSLPAFGELMPERYQHTFVSATYVPNAGGVRVTWTFPEIPPVLGTLRTLVQRYTSPRGWTVGEVYPIDLDASHGANCYLGAEDHCLDTEHLAKGLAYHYYIFCVHDRPDGSSQSVLSQRCDVLVPKKGPVRP